MNTPVSENACPECGSPLASQGLCPRCLLEEAAAPTEHAMSRSNPPSLEDVRSAFRQLEVLEMIGHGGMGAVFKVRQPKLNRWAALKLLPASAAVDPAFAGRFEREAQLLARLSHPNITAVHDYGQAGEFYYVLMEFIDGVNLRQAMRTSRFTPAQALGIVPKICEALQYAHEEGVLHRDIKPENILLDAKGSVKLADFGIAKIITETDAKSPASASVDPTITHNGAALGTPQYMAPEQRDTPTDVDHRADIYSLGVVFYELLTGELPVGKFAPPSAISAADPRVDAIVQQALEKERERRQHSAGEMKTQVETLRGTAGAVTLPFSNPPPATTSEIRRMVAVPAIGLMVASALNLLFFSAALFYILFAIPWETTPAGDVAKYTIDGMSFSITDHSLTGLHPWTTLIPPTIFFGIIPSLITFFGALRMRRFQGYGWAITGALLGMVTPPGLLIGIVFGIWALVVLARREVRDRFCETPVDRRSLVRAPALALMGISAINLLTLGRFLFLVLSGAVRKVTPTGDVLNYAGPGLSFGIEMPHTGVDPALLTITPVLLILTIVPGLTFLGAWRMRELRGYGLAIAAAVLAILTPFGIFGGAIVGIWALAILLRGDVRASFDGGKPKQRRVGFLLAVGIIVGVVVLLISFGIAGKILFKGATWHVNSAVATSVEGSDSTPDPDSEVDPGEPSSPAPPALNGSGEIDRSGP